ncbi:MAG: type II toxin-antitoxin system Phd/YefM family antitoxin [Myxococcaceae bacterium]
MRSYTTREARENFSEIVNLAAFSKNRVPLTRRNKTVAFLVPIEDIETIQAYEDAMDLAECNRSRVNIASGEETLIPWEQVKQELGL